MLRPVTRVFGSVKGSHTLTRVSQDGEGQGQAGMRKRMTWIMRAVAAYALAAGLLVMGAAVLAGTVIRQAVSVQAA